MNNLTTSNGSSDYDILSNDRINRVNSTFKLMLTNARSLSPKIHSLHTFFEEHDLDVALVTESWLKDGEILDRDVIDLEHGTGLKIIYRNRPKNARGLRKVGGGVSVIFKKGSCNLRERRIAGNNFELVLAVGRVGRIEKQTAFFCVYIEPRMKACELKNLCDLIGREVLLLKAKGDTLFFIGGDLNRRSLDDALADFPDIQQINHAPTRGDACLDIVYSNAPNLNPSMWPPLETPTGVASDHDCVLITGHIERTRDFNWVKKTTRKHTDAALEEYGRRLAETDWDSLLPVGHQPDRMVEDFQNWVQVNTDELFPLKTVRCRSNEKPWITDGIRKLSRQKARVYKREGKSPLWWQLDARMRGMLESSMTNFVDNMTAGGQRGYFAAVKKLGNPHAKTDWSLANLFPDVDEKQAGEEAASYFTRICNLFDPLSPDDLSDISRRPISTEEVAKRLKEAKKPNSAVVGDPLPRVTKAHHQLLTKPATNIFNAVFRSGRWPTAWKQETTVVIPKVSNPSTLAECRNISCTPFLSKVLEGVILDDLRAEVPVDAIQYGGIKGCSVDHLLVDLFDTVLEPLESGSSSVVLGIDYEKAFNRLDHQVCLDQLVALGASPTTVSMIRSFLTGRSMAVRNGSSTSSNHPLNGGSPQGSILGCSLYCAATQQIDLKLINRPLPAVLPAAGAPALAPQVRPTAPPTPEEGMGLLQDAVPSLSDTSSDDSFVTAVEELDMDLDALLDPDVLLAPLAPLVMFKYIDDTTTVETVPPEAAIRHISSQGPKESLPADFTRELLGAVATKADDIGMRVNCAKTQMLCFSPDNGYTTSAQITVGGETITSKDTMKLLGFMLGTAPGVSAHVAHLLAKFRGKFWSLIHLRQAGIRGPRLFKIYCSTVRPVLESNSVVFHSMLTAAQAERLEKLQKLVCRLCFGIPSYTNTLRLYGISTLEERRVRAINKFVAKTIASNDTRFSSKWFVRRPEVRTDIRRRNPFVQKRARTERYLKSPLVHMQKIANQLHAGT